jgi:hypothetical protein
VKDFPVTYYVLRRKDILNFGAICFVNSFTHGRFFEEKDPAVLTGYEAGL